MPLSDVRVKNLKPKDKPYRVADAGGLYVLIPTTGTKLWRYDYRLAGVRKTFAIGVYPEVSLAEARITHAAARSEVKSGIDPVAQKQVVRQGIDDTLTFEEVGKQWLALIHKPKRDKAPRAKSTIDRDIRNVEILAESFGKLPITQVKAAHLTKVLIACEDAGTYSKRERLQTTAVNIAGFAQGRAMIEHNPFLGINYGKAFTSTLDNARPAIIEPEPFGQLLRDLDGYKLSVATDTSVFVKFALKLIALMFVRPGSVVAAEWSDFDLDARMWTIPFDKLKMRNFRQRFELLRHKPHYVPLARQTIALLRELKELTGDSPYLFPCRTGNAMLTASLDAALRTMGYEGRHVPHGFRSSASTMLNAEEILVEGNELPRFHEAAIEFQLEHVDGRTAAIYNRNQRLPERIRIMQFWADKIDQLRTGAPLRSKPRLVVAA